MTTAELIPLDVKIQTPSPAVLSRGADAALALVNEFEVTDEATYGLAAEELQAIKARAAKLEEQRKSITAPLDSAKKAVMDLFRGPIEVLAKAEGILKGKLLGYQQEQQRIANEARIAAERAAEEQRQRVQAEAQALAAQGRTGEAAVKEQVAQMIVAAPIAAPAPAPVKGLSTRETVEFEVVDLLALVKAAAEKPELVALLAVDSVKLRAYVKGLGLQCNLPGVRVFTKQSLASRKS